MKSLLIALALVSMMFGCSAVFAHKDKPKPPPAPVPPPVVQPVVPPIAHAPAPQRSNDRAFTAAALLAIGLGGWVIYHDKDRSETKVGYRWAFD